MRVFKEVTLPTTCYIPEVALWISLGRPPEYLSDDDGKDARGNEDGELAPYDGWGFSEREFAMVGLKVDMDRYLEARTSVAWMFDVRADVARFAVDDENRLMISQMMENAEHEAAEAEWARTMEEGMIPLMDRGRAAVFQALASGELLAKGWQEHPNCPDYDFDGPRGSFISIDPKLWSLRGFDWENSELITSSGRYSTVSVSMEDVLRVFPAPAAKGIGIDGLMYSETIILRDDTPAINPKRGRGRPPKSVGDIRTVVMNVFEERKRRGDLPEKTEAIVAEVMDFVQVAFNQTIVRSTAQSYIAGITLSMAENLPENAAG